MNGGGETVDVFIKLPETQWPTLEDTEKEHRLFHELCHVKPAKDSNGKQKRDAKDRLLWRLGRHPITAFNEEIERFGLERVIGHNAKIMESIAHAERPMEKLFDQAEAGKGEAAATSADSWKLCRVGAAGFTEKQVDALEGADLRTLGELQEAMNRNGQFWAKNTGVSGRMRQAIEETFTAYITALATSV